MLRIKNRHVLVFLRDQFLNGWVVGVHVVLDFFELLGQLLHLLSQLVAAFDGCAGEGGEQLLNAIPIVLQQLLLAVIYALEIFGFDASERVFPWEWFALIFGFRTALKACVRQSLRFLN